METTIKVGRRVYNRHAWTGGNTPPDGFSHPDYRALRKRFFREQIDECGGLNLWECAGTSALDRARIFWNRARLDAWRTFCWNRKRVPRVAAKPTPVVTPDDFDWLLGL